MKCRAGLRRPHKCQKRPTICGLLRARPRRRALRVVIGVQPRRSSIQSSLQYQDSPDPSTSLSKLTKSRAVAAPLRKLLLSGALALAFQLATEASVT